MDLPQIPGYRAVGLVGEGNFRTVYKAWKVIEPPKRDVYQEGDRTQIFPCALKVYKGQLPIGWDRELISLRDLEPHRNLERLYNFGPTENGFYLEAELVKGRPILERDFEDVGGRRKATRKTFTMDLSVRDAVHITLELARALGHLHKNGYIARDLSLSNVLVNDGLSVIKVCDLGDVMKLGDKIERQEGPTTNGKELVNWNYLAPEIRREGGDIATEVVDAYSLGSVFLYMLFSRCRRPFDSELSVANLDHTDKAAYEKGLRERINGIDFGQTDRKTSDQIMWTLRRLLDFEADHRENGFNFVLSVFPTLTKRFELSHEYTGKNVIISFKNGRLIYGRAVDVEMERGKSYVHLDRIVELYPHDTLADEKAIRNWVEKTATNGLHSPAADFDVDATLRTKRVEDWEKRVARDVVTANTADISVALPFTFDDSVEINYFLSNAERARARINQLLDSRESEWIWPVGNFGGLD